MQIEEHSKDNDSIIIMLHVQTLSISTKGNTLSMSIIVVFYLQKDLL